MQLTLVEQILQIEKIDVVQHHEEGESPEHGEERDAQRILLQSRGPASGAGIEPTLSIFLAESTDGFLGRPRSQNASGVETRSVVFRLAGTTFDKIGRAHV